MRIGKGGTLPLSPRSGNRNFEIAAASPVTAPSSAIAASINARIVCAASALRFAASSGTSCGGAPSMDNPSSVIWRDSEGGVTVTIAATRTALSVSCGEEMRSFS